MAIGNVKGMAYLLVGQGRDWGKSKTLNGLPGVGSHTHKFDIMSKKDGKTYPFYIRHMSNTDNSESYIHFLDVVIHTNVITKATYRNIIATFSVGDQLAEDYLKILSQNYNLRCFVLRYSVDNPPRVITQAEITLLQKYAVQGGVHDYNLQNSPPAQRAAAFLSYMETETPF
jgi:hypothetical protein